MHYIVEVAIEAGNLALELSQMRTWLDHMKFQAIGFRQIPGANIYRVGFEGEQEAKAFAQAFTGQVLNRTAVECRTLPRSRKIRAGVVAGGAGAQTRQSARDHDPGIAGADTARP
jgi:hypothetical protein